MTMNQLWMNRGILRLLGVIVAAVMTIACTHVGESWIVGGMEAAAQDQIMLVRKVPPSFGFQRLTTQAHKYPDLGLFVAQRGLPNFLAETGNDGRHYYILYYLKKRESFACRAGPGNGLAVEFAGPYPITAREYHLLDGFRRDPSREPRW
jgi:hypothetical protein